MQVSPKAAEQPWWFPASIDAPDHDDLISEVEVSVAERERQARIYLEAVPGTQEGTGADRSCTALTMRLLYGFALPADTVLEMLAEWGQKADQLDTNGGWWPWTEEEISRKIEWCLRHEYDGEVGDRLHACREMDAGIDEIVVAVRRRDLIHLLPRSSMLSFHRRTNWIQPPSSSSRSSTAKSSSTITAAGIAGPASGTKCSATTTSEPEPGNGWPSAAGRSPAARTRGDWNDTSRTAPQ